MAKTPADIRSLARSHTEEAINTCVMVMRNSTNDSAKMAAVKEIFDRGWGKAEVKAEITTKKYVIEVPAMANSVEEWVAQAVTH